ADHRADSAPPGGTAAARSKRRWAVSATPPRPLALTILPDAIPPDLRPLRQYVVWRYELRGKDGQKKWTKPPYTPTTGLRASVTDPASWGTWDEALAAYRAGGWDGIGLVLTPNARIVAADLDHCRDRETGTLTPEAAEIVETLDGYTEATPSGEGVRVLVRG